MEKSAMTPTTVLFVCARNAGLSIMAEAYLNHLALPDLRAFSAGLEPAETVHPGALRALAQAGLALEALAPKAMELFALPQAPQPDVVVALGPEALGGREPRWARPPRRLGWPIGDPASRPGPVSVSVFSEAFAALRERIDRAVAEAHFAGLSLARAV